MRFFLRGVQAVADSAQGKARDLFDLFSADRNTIETKLGRKAGSALRVHEQLQRNPVVKIPELARQLSMSKPTIATALQELEALSLVSQLGEKKRGKTYIYRGYVNILNEDT